MAYKKWIIADADKEKASDLSEQFNIDPFIAFMLVSRGIESSADVADFLASSYDFSDPFLLCDMERAVSAIEEAVDYGEKITVFGDYDCDGVTATVLLYTFLKDMGADVDYYIPSRLNEGYGMNKASIDKIKENGTKLIITVDNGISAIEEAEYIYSLGMRLVVTDHHQVGNTLPRAEAVVNPHRAENEIDFRDFSGVGVAFKLACAIYGDTEDMLYQFADLVALGTISDVMPLVSENRAFVKAGIKLINGNSRIGIDALKKAAGAGDKELTATDIAFTLCPRINATGRVDDAARAAELLISENEEDAVFRAEQINIDNAHRQELEQNIFEDVKLRIAENPDISKNRVIVVCGKNYHMGVVGIVAAKVLEEYGKPTIILSEENGTAMGSARSIDGFNIYEAIASCSDMLDHFGGHPKAAGLGLNTDNVDEFRCRINEYAVSAYPIMPVQSINVDCKISPAFLNVELVDSLSVLEPFGEANRSAVFALMNLRLISVTPMGNGKHIRLECEKKGKSLKISKFRCTADEFPFAAGEYIDVVVKASKNLYNGREYLSLQAVDIKRHGNDDDKYFNEKEEYELFVLNKNNSENVYPDREDCSVIYKFLRQKKGWRYGFDELYFALNSVTYGKLKFALEAFLECCLIEYNENDIHICNVSAKVDLMNTPVIKKLKGRLGLE